MIRKDNKKGMTFVEVLIAVLILALFVSAATVGMNSMFGTSRKIMNVSKSSVLGASTVELITNEFRYSEIHEETQAMLEKEIEGLKESATVNLSDPYYNSPTYGDKCRLSIDDKGRLIVIQPRMELDTTDNTFKEQTKTFLLIGEVSYDQIKITNLTVNAVYDVTVKDNKVTSTTIKYITVDISIGDGDNVLWQNTVTVTPLSLNIA